MAESIVGKTVSDTSHSALIWIANAAVGYIFWLAMGRLLLPADFGVLSTILALYGLLSLVVTLNSADVAVKFLPMYRQEHSGKVDAFMSLLLVFVGIGSIAAAAVLWIFAGPLASRFFSDTRMVLGLKCLGALLLSGSIYAALRSGLYAEQKFSAILRTDLLGAIVRVTAGITLVLAGLAVGGLVGWFLGFCISLLLALRYLGWKLKLSLAGLELRKIGGYVVASTAAALVSSVYMQGATIIISTLAGLTQAGLMGAAVIFGGLLGIATSIIYSAALPMLSHLWAQGDVQRFTRLLNNAVRYSLLATVPGLLIMWGFGPWIISMFYSSSYAQSNALLLPYMVGLIFGTYGGFHTAVLHLGNRPSWRAAVLGVAAVTNVLLGVWLVPIYGAVGAAVGFAVASIVYSAFAYVLVRSIGIRPALHVRLLIPAAGLGLVVAGAQFLPEPIGLIASLTIGLLVYTVLALWSGAVTKGDALVLRNITIKGFRPVARVADVIEMWARF
jgi:O-antigen/teichoic acid export membrane protein